MKNISPHISYKEATKSWTATKKGIENKPNALQLLNMRHLANHIFEPLRAALGGLPIGIASFFRAVLLNKIIGGSETSQHCEGEAVDLDADIYNNGITNRMIFNFIKDNLDFDQLIWEFGTDEEPNWVHVSLKRNGKNRKQILVAYKHDGRTMYKLYNNAA